jgi:hypothetical protein
MRAAGAERGCSGAFAGYFVPFLLVVSLSRCLVVSLSRCLVVSLSRCLVVSLSRCLVVSFWYEHAKVRNMGAIWEPYWVEKGE